MNNRFRSHGFTLLELLVVMVIIGIMASFAVLQLGDHEADRIEEEAKRLRVLVRLAREEAILQGREYAMSFQEGAYAFHEINDDTGKWQPTDSDPALRQRVLEDLPFELVLDGQYAELPKKVPEKPQVYLFSSGEMTPFVVSFRLDDLDAEPVQVGFDELGRDPDAQAL